MDAHEDQHVDGYEEYEERMRSPRAPRGWTYLDVYNERNLIKVIWSEVTEEERRNISELMCSKKWVESKVDVKMQKLHEARVKAMDTPLYVGNYKPVVVEWIYRHGSEGRIEEFEYCRLQDLRDYDIQPDGSLTPKAGKTGVDRGHRPLSLDDLDGEIDE